MAQDLRPMDFIDNGCCGHSEVRDRWLSSRGDHEGLWENLVGFKLDIEGGTGFI